MRLQDEVRSIVEREGVIVRRQHLELAGAIKTLKAAGRLVPVLPGVYVVPALQADFRTRVLAAVSWDPDVVLTGETAARLTFWPELTSATVECATRWQRADQPGYVFSRRVVPPELVVDRGRLRVADPAITALDLCGTRGGDGIDRALRARATTLDRMRWAFELSPRRAGNRDRRWLLLDSRDEPWSAAERLCHRLLRDARVQGWKPNWPVHVRGSTYYLDVAFPRLKIVLEIDGRLHEEDPKIFENDRWRQNALVLDGWWVLRFTWRMLEDHPDKVLAAVLGLVAAQSSAR
jgi:very-short-patch-repair endonuclease